MSSRYLCSIIQLYCTNLWFFMSLFKWNNRLLFELISQIKRQFIFIGTLCEIGANPCWSNPCQNNGNCSISSNSYSCQCTSLYSGTNCDLMINVCTSNPCLNNGHCIRDSNMQDEMYRCQCSNGYIGERCEYGKE
jgi:hypothetical protein